MKVSTLQSLISRQANQISELEKWQVFDKNEIRGQKRLRQQWREEGRAERVEYATQTLSELYARIAKTAIQLNKLAVIQKELKHELRETVASGRAFSAVEDMYDDTESFRYAAEGYHV